VALGASNNLYGGAAAVACAQPACGLATARIVSTAGADWRSTSWNGDEIEQWQIVILDFKTELDRFHHAFTKLIK